MKIPRITHRTAGPLLFGALLLIAPLRAQEIVRPPDPSYPASTGTPAAATVLSTGPNASETSNIFESWQGMSQTGTIRPPDPHGAVGLDGVLQVVNLRIAYYRKPGLSGNGQSIWAGTVNLNGFFPDVVGSIADPKAIYDPLSNRFFVILQDNAAANSYLHVAVSRSANPGTATVADWIYYRFDITQQNGTTKYGGDYPGLGYDANGIYVTYNMFSLPIGSTSTFYRAQIFGFRKADLVAGVTPQSFSVATAAGLANGFSIQPVSNRDPGLPATGTVYFTDVNLASTTSVRIYAVSDPFGTPQANGAFINVADHGGAINDAPQAGTSITLDTVPMRAQGNAFLRDGQVWFCQTAGGSLGRSRVNYYALNTNGWPTSGNNPSLGEEGNIDGGAGVWTFQPAIGGNDLGETTIVYSQSSATTFPSISYVSRGSGAIAFETPVSLHTSPTFYNSTTARARWGDYACVAVDPTDESFWVTHEAALNSTANDQWTTRWGRIRPNVNPMRVESWRYHEETPGSYYSIGFIRTVTDSSGNTYGLRGGAGVRVAKFNSRGEPQAGWDVPYYSTGAMFHPQCIALDSNGNVVVGGGRDESVTSSDTDFAAVKFNSNGTLAWTKTYASGTGAVAEHAFDICVDSQNAVIATGIRANATSFSYLTVKWDSAGVRKWTKMYDAPTTSWDDFANWISVDSSGDVYVSGYSLGPYAFPNSVPFNPARYNQCAVLKYRASDGVKLWEHVYTGSLASRYMSGAGDPTPDNAGNVYICGYKDDIGFVSKLNASSGSQVWTCNVPIIGAELTNLFQIKLGAGDELYGTGWHRTQGSTATNPDADFTSKLSKSAGTLSWTNTSVAVDVITSSGELLGLSPQSDDFYDIGVGVAKVDPVTGSTLWAVESQPPAGMSGLSPRGFLTADGSGNAYVLGSIYESANVGSLAGTFFAKFGLEQ